MEKKEENKRGLKLNMKYSFVGWNPLVNAHFLILKHEKDDLQTKSKFLEFANYHLKPAKKQFFNETGAVLLQNHKVDSLSTVVWRYSVSAKKWKTLLHPAPNTHSTCMAKPTRKPQPLHPEFFSNPDHNL